MKKYTATHYSLYAYEKHLRNLKKRRAVIHSISKHPFVIVYSFPVKK